MDVAEYLESVSSQIRCRRAREVVARELKSHIDDQTQEYIAQGISEEEALQKAVQQMGDAVEAGMEMDRIHRPRFDKKMLFLIAVFAIAGGMIQFFIRSLTEEGSILLSVGITILSVVTGVGLMAALQLVDYTIIGKHPFAIWVSLLLIPTAFRLSGAVFPITETPTPILLLGLTLPGYCGIVYHYRNKGIKGLIMDILWVLPLILVYLVIWRSEYPTNLTQVQIMMILFSCLVIHIFANLTILPVTDIYLPFCYPSFSMNAVCYTLAGLYLSVYRYTDVVA